MDASLHTFKDRIVLDLWYATSVLVQSSRICNLASCQANCETLSLNRERNPPKQADWPHQNLEKTAYDENMIETFHKLD